MTDEKRLADALRAKGFYVSRNDAGEMCQSSDEEVLAVTEGTCFRAGVELDIACADLRDAIREEFGKPAAKIMFAVGRFIRWLTKGGRNGAGRDN